MSLEQALNENTLAMRELTAALLGKAGTVEIDTRTIAAHTKDAARTETRYFHDAKAKQLYAVGPTDSLMGLQGNKNVVEINEAQYNECRAAYDKLSQELRAGNVQTAKPDGPAATPSPAPGPTAGAQTTTTVVEPSTPALTAADWDKDVMPALKSLAQKPSDAGQSLKAVLKEMGVPMVPALKAKCAGDSYAALMACIAKWSAATTEQAAEYLK